MYSLVLQLPHGFLAGGDVLDRADLPERLADQLAFSVTQHILKEWVGVGDPSCIPVQDQDSVFGGLEEPAVASLRIPLMRFLFAHGRKNHYSATRSRLKTDCPICLLLRSVCTGNVVFRVRGWDFLWVDIAGLSISEDEPVTNTLLASDWVPTRQTLLVDAFYSKASLTASTSRGVFVSATWGT